MADLDYLNWPFFEPRHGALARELDAWAAQHIGHEHPDRFAGHLELATSVTGRVGSFAAHAVGTHAVGAHAVDSQQHRVGSEAAHPTGSAAGQAHAHGGAVHIDESDVDATCRALVARLGQAGWLRHAIGGVQYGGAGDAIDTRTICLIRETLARHAGLADFAFAMQGLGSGAISLFGTDAQKSRYLPQVAAGRAIAAFALSEPEAGSDVAAMACAATLDGDDYVLDGEKTWISNGGIADFYVVFARTGEQPGARGISAFIVDAGSPGLDIAERIALIAPHPLARLRFTGCRVPATQRIGAAGQGFKVAMATLDVFRTSVAAAALGFARRALDEALARAASRKMFGKTLADFQLTQAKLAQMATGIDAAALLTYRAAWLRDGGARVTKEAAMAKLSATETAQQVIDAALQMFGGLGVVSGQPVESLYREIRALRIYEGASEVQQLIIARELLAAHAATEAINPSSKG